MERLSAFATARKIIEVGFQDEEETRKVIEFNTKNKNEYQIVHDGNLLDAKCLILYLRAGYEICKYGHDHLTLKHTDLLKLEEQVNEEYNKKKDK